VSNFALLAGLFFLVAVLLFVLNVFRVRASSSQVRDYVRGKGYVLLNPPSTNTAGGSPVARAISGLTGIDGLERSTEKGDTAFVCRLHGHDVTVFNATLSSSRVGATASDDVQYRVAKIPGAGLPRFSLGRHDAVELVQKLVDHLVQTPNTSLDRGEHPAFFKKYWMKGPDGAVVYEFLTPPKLDFLAAKNLKGTLAANGPFLVYFESQRRAMHTAGEYDSFIAVVDDLVSHLL
jgi:hypothetical protein